MRLKGFEMTQGTGVVGGAARRRTIRPSSRVGRLLDAIPEAVVITDTAHRVTGWNDAAETLFGVLSIVRHRLPGP